ncbi:MAG: hypothetical protein QOI49_2910, partial [Verrucomicrobiota bacterium]
EPASVIPSEVEGSLNLPSERTATQWSAHSNYSKRFFDCVSLLRNFAQNDRWVLSGTFTRGRRGFAKRPGEIILHAIEDPIHKATRIRSAESFRQFDRFVN